MRHTVERRNGHFRSVVRRHGSDRAVDLRLQRDPSHPDPVGHQPETRIVPDQPVPAPEHAGQSDNHDFYHKLLLL